jgi:hypothetical protein
MTAKMASATVIWLVPALPAVPWLLVAALVYVLL